MKGDDKTMSSLQDDFSEKYEKYSSTIFKIAITYLANKADAEDVMQDVFIKLLYSSPDFDNDDYEKFWIIRTTSNICKNILKSFRHKNTEDIDDFKEFLAEPSKTNIAELLLELNPKHRIVLYLMYYEGYSVKEISDMLCITQSAVKMRLKRGREQLKIDIEEGNLHEKAGFYQNVF